MVPLGCASEAGILKWWHTTFAHTFVCTQPQNAKILLENIYADENVFFRIPSNLLLFNKNFVKLNACVSNLFYGHLFKRIIISCSESKMFQNWCKQLRRLIEGSNESVGPYMFEGFEFWNLRLGVGGRANTIYRGIFSEEYYSPFFGLLGWPIKNQKKPIQSSN